MKNKNIYYTLLAAISIILASITISCEEDSDNDLEDVINPVILGYNPISGVGGVDLTSNLVLTFDEIIEKGQGNITITADHETATQVIDVNSDQVTISDAGRTLTINPQDFLAGRPYQVVLDAGFVKDQVGNEYYIIPGTQEWVFTSGGNAGDIDAPEIAELSPADDASDSYVTGISINFNEDVKVGIGNIVVYNSSDVAVATYASLR